jgi:hypothetical protein
MLLIFKEINIAYTFINLIELLVVYLVTYQDTRRTLVQVIVQSQNVENCISVRKYPTANNTISYHVGYIGYLFSYTVYYKIFS